MRGFNGLSVVSLRHPEEAKRIKDHDGIVVWVDADPLIRYKRVAGSMRNRIDDQKTFDEFIEEENADMYPSQDADPARVNMSAVRNIADIHVVNDFSEESSYIDYLSQRFEF